MRLRRYLKFIYLTVALPILRGAATPCFRLAVHLAAAAGVLPRAPHAAVGSRESFLIVHLSNHLGDTVMLLPMIDALRSAHPTALIECAVQAPMTSFLKLVPGIDSIYEFDLGFGPTSTPWLELRRTLAIIQTYWRTMRRAHPLVCIIPRWGCGFRDLMLAYLTRAPRRIGFASNDFDRSQPPAGYRDALLTQRVQGAQRMSEPARFLFLIERAGIISHIDHAVIGSHPNPSILSVAATVDWPKLAARLQLDPGARLAVVAPGASAPRRMWPVDRWAVIIDSLHREGFTVVLLTGSQDAHVARQLYEITPITRRSRTVLVAGVATLPESTCLLAHSRLFVGNDSGPGHIAGALCVPCVVLFIAAEGSDPDGPSAPERVRPMGRRVICCRPTRTISPCSGFCTADSAHCILQIHPNDPLRAIQSLLHVSEDIP